METKIAKSDKLSYDLVIARLCVKYFQHIYIDGKEDTDRTRGEEIVKSDDITIKEEPKLLNTPFHKAIAHQKIGFVQDVMDLMDCKIRRFVLNCEVTFEHVAPDDPYLIPDMAFLEQIRDSLTTEELSLAENKSCSGSLFQQGFLEHDAEVTPTCPLTIAAFTGNENLFVLLLSSGADLDKMDPLGNTVIHRLVMMSNCRPEAIVKIYDVITSYITDKNQLADLILARNNKGYTALDVAGKVQSPEMIHALMRTEQVYKFHVGDCGLFHHYIYDVTDYEKEDVDLCKSLLYSLTEMDESTLHRAQKCQLLSSEPFQSWIKVKRDNNKFTILYFIIFWILFGIFYVGQLAQYFNHGHTHPVLHLILILFAVCVVVPEIYYSRSNFREIARSVKKVIRHGRVPVTFTFSYRVFQLIFCLCMFFNSMAMIRGFECSAVGFFRVSYVISTMCGALSFLFFLQLHSGIGHLLIAIQKLVYDTCLFIFMVGVVFLGFSASFFLLHLETGCSHGNHPRNSSNPCGTDMFRSFPRSAYETFLLILTVMAPSDIYFPQAVPSGMAILLYIMCLIIVYIILLNMLIAIMARRLEELAILRDDILKLETLSIVLYIEHRLNTKFMKAVLNTLKKAKINPSVTRSSFFTDHINGKIYVTTAEILSQ